MQRLRRSLTVTSLIACILLVFAGCATLPGFQSRPFRFGQDTFAFANELTWEYFYDADGKWTSRKREPAPDYTLHCFPVAKSAKIFFLNARFDPTKPAPCDEECRTLVRRVMGCNPRESLPDSKKIIIPGYADLNAFSQAHEDILKEECGSGLSSYLQRGHWRMVLPFCGRQRAQTAAQFMSSVDKNCPTVAHVLNFPSLSINHAILIFGAEQQDGRIVFLYYDPNDPNRPGRLTFDPSARRFSMETNPYFPGGEVQVYEVFHRWNY